MMINGIQYCTEGWIVGEPGTHEMTINYPTEWRDVECTAAPREAFNLDMVITSKVYLMSRTVVFKWINGTDDAIPFDYTITEK